MLLVKFCCCPEGSITACYCLITCNLLLSDRSPAVVRSQLCCCSITALLLSHRSPISVRSQPCSVRSQPVAVRSQPCCCPITALFCPITALFCPITACCCPITALLLSDHSPVAVQSQPCSVQSQPCCCPTDFVFVQRKFMEECVWGWEQLIAIHVQYVMNCLCHKGLPPPPPENPDRTPDICTYI